MGAGEGDGDGVAGRGLDGRKGEKYPNNPTQILRAAVASTAGPYPTIIQINETPLQ